MEDIKVLIMEDDIGISMHLESLIKKNGYNNCDVVYSGEECLAFVDKDIPDLLIADIELKGELNGIQVAEQLNDKYQLPVIFLTGNPNKNNVIASKKANTISFLSKPFNDVDVLNAMELAIAGEDNLPEEKEEKIGNFAVRKEWIFVKKDNAYKKVKLADILYLEAHGAYCSLHTYEHVYMFSMNLKKVLSKLSFENLLRVHNSFVVNIENIDGLKNHSILVKDKEIPIGRKYNEKIKKLLIII